MSSYFVFLVASITLAIIPGPTITVIIANSLRYGARAGLTNVAGTQVGLALMLLIVAFSLEWITLYVASVLPWLKAAGVAYLLYLAYKMLRSDGELLSSEALKAGESFFLQGFLVVWSNPKALFFFGAFIPQFVSPDMSPFTQTVFLGVLFMFIGTFFDSLYALASAKLGGLLKAKNIRQVEISGAVMMIIGAAWLVFNGSI